MKKLSLSIIIVLIVLPFFSFSQTLEIAQSDKSFIRSDKTEFHSIHLTVKGINPETKVFLIVEEDTLGTAIRKKDYELISPYRKLITDTAIIVILIKPEKDQKTLKTLKLNIRAIWEGKPMYTTAELTIKPFEKKAKGANVRRELADIDSARFTILTAGSLNFFGNSFFSKYVGQLDVRLPSLLGKNRRWGINTGVFTKDFYVDTISVIDKIFNIKKASDPNNYIEKRYGTYAKNVISVVGAYANPTFLLAHPTDEKNSSFRIYAVASIEVLATSIKTTYSNYTFRDSSYQPYNTSITSGNVLDPAAPLNTDAKPMVKQSYITGYFGAGPQLVYHQNNLLNLNLLFLSGVSITGDTNISGVPPTGETFVKPSPGKFYYLAKGVITEKVTKLNATIGVEVRGFYPNNTGIAAYLGFLISPADFFKK
jgi:hypothetical protein